MECMGCKKLKLTSTFPVPKGASERDRRVNEGFGSNKARTWGYSKSKLGGRKTEGRLK